MKKYLLLLVCVLFAQSFYALSNSDNSKNDEGTKDIPKRKVYAYFQNNYDFDGNYGIGITKINDPSKTELIIPFNGEGIFAGAVANGIYYACTYEYQMSAPPKPQNLIAYNLTTGNKKEIGPWAIENEDNMKVLDMTYNYANNTMYALAYSSYMKGIFKVDLNTGTFTELIKWDIYNFPDYKVIAANYDGQIFIMGTDGKLYEYKEKTNIVEEIGKIDYTIDANRASLEFDHTDGNLYLSTSSRAIDNNNCHLLKININETGVTYDDLGRIGSQTSETLCYGLYIPFVIDGEDAPAAPTNFTIIPDEKGELKATLKWKNPETTFGEDPLTNLSSITILRNNEIIANIPTTEIGKDMEWIDEEVPSLGEYEYTIYANNNIGIGEKIIYNQYIGPDSPAAVTDVIATPGQSCENISLSWVQPTEGFHGNYCDPQSIRYKIIRYPDETIIAEDITDTKIIDNNIKRLARYHYEVYAYNEVGGNSSISKNYVIAGPAKDIPYNENFNDYNNIINNVSFIDGNKDEYSWNITSELSYYIFGDNQNAIGYIIMPGYTPQSMQNNADEWFITPPLNFEPGVQYSLKFEYRSIKNEQLEISTGNNNSAETQNVLETVELKAIEGSEPIFSEYTMLLPNVDKNEIRTIGFHLTTPLPEDLYSFVQITNIEITGQKGINSESNSDNISIITHNGNIQIIGEFEKALIYATDGTIITETRENSIETNTFNKGIYIIKIIKDNKVQTYKIKL